MSSLFGVGKGVEALQSSAWVLLTVHVAGDVDLDLDPKKAEDKGEWCLLTVLQRLRMLDS